MLADGDTDDVAVHPKGTKETVREKGKPGSCVASLFATASCQPLKGKAD